MALHLLNVKTASSCVPLLTLPALSLTPSPSVSALTDGKAAFCIFLKSEFCEENIEFWTACEDFRTHTSHKQLVSKANSIYEEFIKSEAPKEVTNRCSYSFQMHDLFVLSETDFKQNLCTFKFYKYTRYSVLKMDVRGSYWLILWLQINLDFHTKNAIAQSLHEPTATSFLAAQKKVYSLMENNSYPRFIHSDLYKGLCEAASREGKHIKS